MIMITNSLILGASAGLYSTYSRMAFTVSKSSGLRKISDQPAPNSI